MQIDQNLFQIYIQNDGSLSLPHTLPDLAASEDNILILCRSPFKQCRIHSFLQYQPVSQINTLYFHAIASCNSLINSSSCRLLMPIKLLKDLNGEFSIIFIVISSVTASLAASLFFSSLDFCIFYHRRSSRTFHIRRFDRIGLCRFWNRCGNRAFMASGSSGCR